MGKETEVRYNINNLPLFADGCKEIKNTMKDMASQCGKIEFSINEIARITNMNIRHICVCLSILLCAGVMSYVINENGERMWFLVME
ncbi:hypothetical protein ACQFME_004392 [Escherichia coli]|uniref:Uncharacterized protein n=1 Tax=Escherichia coli TaxID=562 RepID=A0A376L2S5_ECOLX|nr:hypothetical protein [Escherichia coli]ELO0115238.1 hypothetical protein [Escherichia coli O157]EFB2482967.1 hypothetical protein [Escherichia coli]EFC4412567.1 hypothetical protein [Escherichia coli]EFD0578604.1 hypothetical protein [Escherichia coli]EFD0944306.1 hypothetical protein [Escherichia coli]